MSMEKEELDFLRNNRKYVRAKVTRKCNSITADILTLSKDKLNDEISYCKDLREEIKAANLQISKGLWVHETDRTKLDQELERCDEYNDKLFSIIRSLETKVKELTEVDRKYSSEMARIGNQLKLPQLPLPVYSHAKGENLDKFFTCFETIVNKYSLSSYEKFIFLEKQLSREPLVLIKSLEGDQQSYDTAKELLLKAFASPITQKFNIIERLAELKLARQDDPYVFISEMRVIVETFKKLNIDTEAILQYFVWRGLNQTFKDQLIDITNCNKPSFTQISDSIF